MELEKLVIGVDGGQTSTKCVLATIDGHVLGEGRGAALLHLAAEGGRERFVQAMREAVNAAWRSAGISTRPLAAAGLGLTGVVAGTPEAETVLELLPAILEAEIVDVQSDAVAALMGAHLGNPGIIVISGTGTIALGIDPQGKTRKAGGWGWLIGDEGSAYAIGRSGLRAALYAYDGMEPATLLEPLLVEHFGITAIPAAKRIAFAPDFAATGFASLAPVVSKAAEQGDPVAQAIIQDAGGALAAEVLAVVDKLHFGERTIPVAPVGGAFEYVHGLRAAFERAIFTENQAIRVIDPALPPVLGAAIMALQACKANTEQTVANLANGSEYLQDRRMQDERV